MTQRLIWCYLTAHEKKSERLCLVIEKPPEMEVLLVTRWGARRNEGLHLTLVQNA